MAPPESTAPRDFRYFTPEPTVASEAQQPSPPRAQPRLKLRRNASLAAGPTQSFLTSVATVDVAIPSIEFPDSTEDCDMVDVGSSDVDTALLSPKRVASPPKTPMPTQSHGDMYRRTDWYAATPRSPDRPSSSYSNPSNCSDDSYFSGNNTMRSNGTMCTSPESDIGDPFVATPYKKHTKYATVTDEVDDPTATAQAPAQAHAKPQARSKKYPEVPWTKDQSDHLLRTYHLYLQDPTVTPFRIEKNSVPPEGIVYRVSKEAKRSWKGPKPKKSKLDNGKGIPQRATTLTVEAALRMRPNSGSMDFANSRGRSMSPTGDAPMPYIKWPHSGAATRSHLRDMCRNNYDQSAQMYMYLQTRGMTPFTQQKAPYAYVPVGYIPVYAAFSTKDVALSLATSTSESMQPDGPLASLSLNSPPAVPEIKVMNETIAPDFGLNTSNTLPKRLGSPFSAKTYGPQTSKSLLHSTGSGVSKSLNSTLRPSQSTITARKPLRSPLQVDDIRPMTGTQKRRAQHDLEYEINASGAVTRPTILDNKAFGTPSDRRVRNRGHTVGDAGSRQRNYACFAPQSINFASPDNDVFGTHRGTQSAGQSLSKGHGLPRLGLLPPPVFRMPGRPVPEHSTFPGRVNSYDDPFQSQAPNMGTVRHRPYHTTQSTQHQTRHSIESFDFTQGPAMQSRLAQIEQRLNEFNQTQLPRGGL